MHTLEKIALLVCGSSTACFVRIYVYCMGGESGGGGGGGGKGCFVFDEMCFESEFTTIHHTLTLRF